MTTLKQAEKNLAANSKDIDTVIALFKRTGNIKRLVTILAETLDGNEFRTLLATEFCNIPLNLEFAEVSE
jgi:hypothetical protein